MDSESRLKRKRSHKNSKQSSSEKSSKKQKRGATDDGQACSMFLHDLAKRIALKRKEQDERKRKEQEEAASKNNSNNILHTIMRNISKIPSKLSRRSSKHTPTSSSLRAKGEQSDNAMVLETIIEPLNDEGTKDILPPEIPTSKTEKTSSLLSASIFLPGSTVLPKLISPTISVPSPPVQTLSMLPQTVLPKQETLPNLAILSNQSTLPSMVKSEAVKPQRKIHDIRMPIVNSEVFKIKKRKTEDSAVNTVNPNDVVSEIAKHVSTLKRISMIAEEFNKKTAKNLKEIVDSVQEDLLKKMEEIQQSQKTSKIEIQTEVTQS